MIVVIYIELFISVKDILSSLIPKNANLFAILYFYVYCSMIEQLTNL